MKNIVFIGDSITDGGTFPAIVESFASTNGRNEYEYINLGVSSENTTALTEVGHPFPRPCALNRIDRIVENLKGEWAVVMYGQNDAIYSPFDEKSFELYKKGITTVVQKLKTAGFRVALMTPTPFDALSYKGKISDTAPFGFENVYSGYNDVMRLYADWIKSNTDADKVIDVYTPVSEYLQKRRQTEPKFKTGDGIHQGNEGNFIIAREILKSLFDITTGSFDETFAPKIYKHVKAKSTVVHRYYKEKIGHDNPYKEKAVSYLQMTKKVKKLNRKIEKRLKNKFF